MTRFILGDELGNIKVLRYSTSTSENKTILKTIHRAQPAPTTPIQVQQLAIAGENESTHSILAAAFSDGSSTVSRLENDDRLTVLSEWKEPTIFSSKFIGLALVENSVFSCTADGMLRMSSSPLDKESASSRHSQTATLPSRLSRWRVTRDGGYFCYGGDEVDLSIWNTESALQSPVESITPSEAPKKRKRNDDLFPAEVWRARNLPNDNLGLRQPIRITSLTFLDSSLNGHDLVTGTQFGDVRRYDTRAARRPVSNWTGIAKLGGVGVVEKGTSEHELFVSDMGCSLSAMDLRNGRTLYSYKGISGAVTSISPSPGLLHSTALDRYARFHSVFPPPVKAGTNQEHRGEVLHREYLTSTPTAAVWDGKVVRDVQSNDGDQNDVWNTMQRIY